ncbi:unnamed protein product [Rotaria magnacalcarata]|uniref:C2 domain-containing protein n=1 Tax=Rotaria magnacalcarata TaxID=392030 RepID=A0A8S2QTM7_9BILA|nr:unnamed protein product [Rotaria magnacalcarata]
MPASDQRFHSFNQDFISSFSPLFPSNLHKSITLAWNIHDHILTSNDTIGTFLPDKLMSNAVIENVYTNVNALKIGQYHWHCTQILIDKLVNSNTVCHQYYNPTNDEIKVRSSSIPLIHDNNDNNNIPNIMNVTRPISIKIYDLHATNLHRGVIISFKPDPYIKVSLITDLLHKLLQTSSHFHNQEKKRTNVILNKCHPKWYNQSFTFETFYTDLLEFEIKDKFVKTRPTMNRFLGKLTIHVGFLIDKLNKSTTTYVVNLQRRNFSDNVSGCLTFNTVIVRGELQTIERPIPDVSTITNVNQSEQETISVNENNVSSITDGEERINHVSSEESNTSNQVDASTSLISNDQSLNSWTTSLVDESLSTVSNYTIGHDEEQEEINEDNIDGN